MRKLAVMALISLALTGNGYAQATRSAAYDKLKAGSLTVSVALTAGNVNNIRTIDGTKFAKTAAGINAADTDCVSGTPCTIVVPFAGTYSDAVISLGKSHTLQFMSGTFTVAGINMPDSSSDTTGLSSIQGLGPLLTTIQLANAQNRDVITDPNFGTLTGGTNNFGVIRSRITGLTVDGNKANNASGFGIRLYGMADTLADVYVQNAAQGGIWLEWGGTQCSTSSLCDVEDHVSNVKSRFNGADGLTTKINDIQLEAVILNSNGGWGAVVFRSLLFSQFNLYNNVSGGVDVKSGGSFLGSGAQFQTLLLEAGSGPNIATNSTYNCSDSAAVGIEIRSPLNQLQGLACGSSTAIVKFNDASAVSNTLNLQITNNTSPIMVLTAGGDSGYYIFNGNNGVGGSLGSTLASMTIAANLRNTGGGLISFFQKLGPELNSGNLQLGGVIQNAAASSTMGLALKKGTGAGNYVTGATYTVADSTNLCYTVTIPTGWKLGITASGAMTTTATGATVSNAALTDNAACSTANSGVLVETTLTPTAINVFEPFALNWVITGDGNAHNIALQVKTATNAGALLNSSATLLPTMVFTLMPSN